MTEVTQKKHISLWMMALLGAVVLHVGLALGIVYLHAEPEGTIGGPEAIMLTFAEEPQAPDVEEVSETIQQATVSEVTAKDEEDVEKFEETPPEPVEEKPVVETPKSDMQEEVKKQEEKPKKLEEPKKVEQPKPEKKKAAKKADSDAKKAEKTQKSSGPQIVAKRGDSYAAPATNRNFGSNGKQVASWKSKVQRRIAFAASRMRGGRSSVGKQALVTFRFDGKGNITSASLERSSGDGDVDAKALQAVKKASPIPAPPEGWNEALTVPVAIK